MPRLRSNRRPIADSGNYFAKKMLSLKTAEAAATGSAWAKLERCRILIVLHGNGGRPWISSPELSALGGF